MSNTPDWSDEDWDGYRMGDIDPRQPVVRETDEQTNDERTTLRLTRPMASWRYDTIDAECIAMAHAVARLGRTLRSRADRVLPDEVYQGVRIVYR
jgi:hypothetical protein